MEITYERKHNESFMVIDGNGKKVAYETKMIGANDISALLDMSSFAIDGKEKMSYQISRKENLEDFIDSHDVTIEMLERIIINLQLALDEINKYLIDEQHIWISKESVFLEKSNDNYKLSLCYYPKEFGTIQEQFRQLMEFFLGVVSKDDGDAVKQLYLAYDLCLKDDYTIEEIIDCLQTRELKESTITEDFTRPEIYVEKVSIDDNPEVDMECQEDYIDYYDDIQEEKKPSFVTNLLMATKDILSKKKTDKTVETAFSEDFYVDPEYEFEERTVLLTDAKAVGKLVYDGNGSEDDFIINKDIFRIGKSKNNDAILKANTVSGSHAKITKEEDNYYLIDNNSLNGTTVNGNTLSYRVPFKLKPMDIIHFASEAYVFM